VFIHTRPSTPVVKSPPEVEGSCAIASGLWEKQEKLTDG
jgi:hypothetical protein